MNANCRWAQLLIYVYGSIEEHLAKLDSKQKDSNINEDRCLINIKTLISPFEAERFIPQTMFLLGCFRDSNPVLFIHSEVFYRIN